MLSDEKAANINVENNKAYVNGILGKKFYKRFVKSINENPQVKTIILEKIPGSINDEWNVQTCIFLHEKGLDTELLPHSIIESGGVDLFISGNKRTIATGSKIGVHSWADLKKDGIEYPKNSKEHDIFFDFFEKIDMDTSFYWYTLRSAQANGMHYMSNDEIKMYNLENP
ncbi:MAG: hypothetical protein P8Q14_09235 [Vicingaceae bacterium]|nr:hypothetical protein [Vicingaceae bacterium]